ncbi:MAG: hypothetical protein KAG99_03795 [Bacteroidales bacterium]|nr:hypothetical protein [Bacteroidales bacterium]
MKQHEHGVSGSKLNNILPEDFFHLTLRSFDTACLPFTEIPQFVFHIGGYTIQLRFAGPSLLFSLTSSLKHLQVEEIKNPDLTIYCWDTKSTGTPLPILPWSDKVYVSEKEIPFLQQNGLHISVKRESGVLSVFDSKSKKRIYWIDDAGNLPFYEKASPFRTLFQWCMLEQQRFCIHSAAVSVNNKGVLLAGREKSGKSTSSLACLLSGMHFAGDDYVVLSDESPYWVYSLYSSAKLEAGSVGRFPELAEKVSNRKKTDTEKAVIYLNQHFPERMSRGFPVSAVLMPHITNGNITFIRKASPAEGIRTLAPSTLVLQTGSRAEAFGFLARFIHQTPCYWLEMGTDMSSVTGVINEFIKGL